MDGKLVAEMLQDGKSEEEIRQRLLETHQERMKEYYQVVEANKNTDTK